MRKWNTWVSLGLTGILVLSCTACGAGNGSGKKGGSQYVGTVLEDGSDVGSDAGSDAGSGADPEGSEEEETDDGMNISQEEVTLLYGRATNVDVYGAKGEVSWENDHPDIVQMEENGDYVMITGQKAGEAVITAKSSGDETVSCHVKVLSAGLFLQDDRGNAGAYSSGTYKLGSSHKYQVFYDADEISVNDVKWKSFDEKVVKVTNGVSTRLD